MTLLINGLLKPVYNVKSFKDVAKALNWIKAGNKVDLIITDYLLPEINGLEFIEYLRNDLLYKGIPTILITGVKPNHLLQEPGLTNSVKIIHKPFNPKSFTQTVHESLLIKQ